MDNHNKESESPTFEKIDFMKHLLILTLVTVFSQPTSAELSDIMTGWLDENDNPAIAGCVVKGNEIIWMDALGMANVEEEYEATVDTPFMLASASKAYTGTALVKAVNDAPGVSLNDPASDHLSFLVQHPDFPQTDITIWQLPTHTSGIDDNWDVMPYCAGDYTGALGDFLFGHFTTGKDDQIETIWNILILLAILSESTDPDTFKSILNELVNVFADINPDYSNTYSKYLSEYSNNDPQANLDTSHKILTYRFLAIKISTDKELSQDDGKSIDELYSYWVKKKNKKQSLMIYINTLRSSPNIPEKLFTLINNIKLIE